MTSSTLTLTHNMTLILTRTRQHMAKETLSSALSVRRQSSFVTLALVHTLLWPFHCHLSCFLYASRRTMITGVQRALLKIIWKRPCPIPSPCPNNTKIRTCLYIPILSHMKFDSYGSYASNLRPLLTEANMTKQVIFPNRVHARWGLPADKKKILCTMSDEKWWHGMVTRTFAKMCPELGVERSSFAVHHKSHIRKVMGHATVGICFTDSPELGCTGFVYSLNRCQGYKVW